jgi:acetyl-CoA C-acetyltransferase
MPGPGIDPSRIKVEPNPKLFSEPEYAKYDIMTTYNMGLTAEKLFEQTDFTREDMDNWAMGSHQKAAKALEEGFFKGEIMPLEVTMPDGTKQVIDHDVSIRSNTTLEALAQLNPSFKPDGVITPANSSPLNTAACMMILMSRKKAKECELKPLAKIISMGWAGVDPSVMGLGPIPASRMALKHVGMKVKDIGY